MFSGYSTYSKEPGESGGSAAWRVHFAHIARIRGRVEPIQGHFWATKNAILLGYMYVRPGEITVLRGLPMPAHLIGSPNPLVSPRTRKGADQAPGIPPQPAQCLKTLFSRFFAPKGAFFKLPRKRGGLKSASKIIFKG